VSGELVLDGESRNSISKQMGFYWNLEKRIRKMESAIDSVPGATGAIYAVRKSLFQPLPEDALLDDVLIPMNVVFQGYRSIYDMGSVAHDTNSENLFQEKRRKVRTSLGNYQLLQIDPRLLSPTRNPLFFRYVSHKVFRLFVPFFFLVALGSSIILDGVFYKFVFALSAATFLFPFIDKFINSVPVLEKISTAACTFVSLNYFAAVALMHFRRPGKKRVW
jgi:hypothetical protein